MSRQDKFFFGVLALLALVVPIGLGVLVALPVWLIAVLTAVALGAVGVRLVAFAREVNVPAPAYPRPTPRPAEPRSFPLGPLSLHSSRADYDFSFAATVCWRPAIRDIRPGGADHGHLAAEAIVGRAVDLVRFYDPADRAMAELRLSAALGGAAQDSNRQVEAWAQDVQLLVPEGDAQRLERLAELRKARELREHEWEAERAHRAYLREDVLTDPGSALIWWLSRHPDRVEEAVRLRHTFALLVAAAANRDLTAPAGDNRPREVHANVHAPGIAANGHAPELTAEPDTTHVVAQDRAELANTLRSSPDWAAPRRSTNGEHH